MKKNASQSIQAISFIIPSDGNQITENDIKQKQIRITAAFKDLFPENDSELKIIIKTPYYLPFKNRGKRSHIIHFTNEAFEELGVKLGEDIAVSKIGDKTFKMGIDK